MSAPEIRIAGNSVTLWQDQQKLAKASVSEFLRELLRSQKRLPACGILPRGVRLWLERGPFVGVAVETPTHCRTIRWVAEDSPAAFGPRATYNTYFISLPYIIVLLIFFDGHLTNCSQLYFRRDSLDSGESLLLPNLRNVAPAYGLRSWVCLVNLGGLGRYSWAGKINRVVNHVLTAGFNLSGEVHEGNSYWSMTRDLDPRVASMDAWEAATRHNPRFILEVPWKRTGTTVTRELVSMLDGAASPQRLNTAADLVSTVTRVAE